MSASTPAPRSLIGIALAAYRPNLEFFRAQLQSIADQTDTDWFCYIGFDSPLADLRGEPSLRSFFDDTRFTFIQNEKTLGLVGNFEATGRACLDRSPQAIAYADQDDIWYPEKLACLRGKLAHLPKRSLVHCDMHVLMKRPDGSFERQPETAWQLERRGVCNRRPLDFFVRNVAAGAGMLVDADLVREFPSIPAEAYGHDHWYALVASFFGGAHPVRKPLYAYRIHGENVLGVSRYRGFFAPSASSKTYGFANKCELAFNSSRARYLAARAAGLPTTFVHRLVTASPLDLGLGYLVKALGVLRRDRALARACMARALGKCLRLVDRKYQAQSRHS